MTGPGSEPSSHVLVVGASSGVGHAVAKRLAATHRVSALARRLDRMQCLAECGIEARSLDVSEIETIEPMVKELVAERGKFSHMVYCAGQQRISPLRRATMERVAELMAVNLLAPIEFGRLFASQRLTTEKAVFCAISSTAAQRAETGIVPYAASKAGLEALIRGLAVECAPRRAVGVAPGWLDTEMTRAFPAVYSADFRNALAKRSPTGIASVEAVVDAVSFLLGTGAQYITGRILTVDGGVTL